ncbi:MAG: penicillin-binding protein 1C [Candidatus Sumerlaeaceae bacterium]
MHAKNIRQWSRILSRGAVIVAAAVLAASFVLALLVAFLPFDPDALFTGEVSSTLFDRHGRFLRAYLARDEQWRMAVPLSEISPWVVRATLAAEDRRFYRHKGVDLMALARATWQNLTHGRIMSGASTITMQVVGLADTRERTLWRKFRQIVRALQLERRRTKEQILELYLTNAPYGGNIRGIEAAAWRYLGKSARTLSPAEAALLAGLPQAPSRYRPDRFPTVARRRALFVLHRMKECGFLSSDDLRRAAHHIPQISTAMPPVYAPHFCDLVHTRFPAEPRVHTTLDLDVQLSVERTLREQLEKLRGQNVTNAAAVVLENGSGDVLALVGSADYWDRSISGQVNGAFAPRSPGSTLKPFVYALALERNVVWPTSMLADVPGLFTNYDPHNYDLQWRGLVPLDRALAWSLNVPAMQVLERIGPAAVLEFLDAAGVRRMMPRDGELGLTLAVGTCSVRLLELANAYAMLARGGVWRPYRLVYPPGHDEPLLFAAARQWNLRQARERLLTPKDSPTSAPVRLLSKDTCYYVNSILCDERLRDVQEVSPELRGIHSVAWKTGTSNGYRDAWTLAYNAHVTVGVWFGNFDGKPSPALVGGRVAAPVALKIINELAKKYAQSPEWPRPPQEVEQVVICDQSGDLACELCPTTHSAKLSKQFTSSGAAHVCRTHKKLLVECETLTLVCPRCMAGRRLKEIIATDWSPAVASWLRAQGKLEGLPPHYAGCPTMRQGHPPQIVAPHDGETFVLASFREREFQKIKFEAVCDAVTSRLYWLLDGELVGVQAAGAPLSWLPEVGRHELRCVDERGRASIIHFDVVADEAGGVE